MRKLLSSAISLAAVSTLIGAPVQPVSADVPVVVPRGGLPNVMAKLRAGKPVTVVFFGGSITAGAGASKPDETSYRGLVGKWLQDTFPKSKITNVNAAIGGTGSDLGAFRTPHDVTWKKPDLVFVEFAVNDGGTPDAMIDRSMEGIARQIWQADRTTDICFVYTFVTGWLEDFRAGKPIRTVLRHEIVAERYGIPSVNVAVPAARKLIDGSMKQDEFAKDGVHPTDAGYRIYADTITGFLESERTAKRKPDISPLPKELRADSFVNTQMLGTESLGNPGAGWRVETTGPIAGFPSVLAAETPGSEQVFRHVGGTTIGLFYVLGPDTGAFDYQIDAGEWKTADPFDVFAKGGYRQSYRILADGLSDAEHTIKFRIRAEHHPDSKGTSTRIGYLLTASAK